MKQARIDRICFCNRHLCDRWRIMRRVLLILAAFFVSLSLTGGAIAHAGEPLACVDSEVAASMGHVSGDSDQVPSDAGKGYVHHHGGCHGHQVCDAVASDGVTTAYHATDRLLPAGLQFIPASPTDPALRPPIA
ncbi:hypothetical protein [Sphingomonas sp. KC8]|jgi:hypothetical protein|uniref:hypothetical protein n=1 Tax=Sphingomonas sp. KC8 TaxID=1030157 RepID=UPI000A31B923|nr:hypothetical protein [Sphingomonas sp. KC8]ARS26437.1 hypothetical protein KC8_03905 [Sphingomonas sp. KC8]